MVSIFFIKGFELKYLKYKEDMGQWTMGPGEDNMEDGMGSGDEDMEDGMGTIVV